MNYASYITMLFFIFALIGGGTPVSVTSKGGYKSPLYPGEALPKREHKGWLGKRATRFLRNWKRLHARRPRAPHPHGPRAWHAEHLLYGRLSQLATVNCVAAKPNTFPETIPRYSSTYRGTY